MNDEQIALTVLVGAEAAHAFSAFMPSYFTIKTFPESQADIDKLRSGYAPAFVFNAILGASAAWLVKSLLPLVAVAIASVGMVALYEHAIAGTGLSSGVFPLQRAAGTGDLGADGD
jgi:hypothetical protein